MRISPGNLQKQICDVCVAKINITAREVFYVIISGCIWKINLDVAHYLHVKIGPHLADFLSVLPPLSLSAFSAIQVEKRPLFPRFFGQT